MSIIEFTGFVVGLLFFYLGYLSVQKNIRRVTSFTQFISPISVLFFVIGLLACFPLARTALQNWSDQQLHSIFSNTEKSGLSNADLVYAKDPKALEDAYQKGVKALKMKQYAEAEKWIRQAALGGIGEAQFSLATLYENGFGLPKDGEQACYWYRVAADNKNIDAEKALERPVKGKKDEGLMTWQAENC